MTVAEVEALPVGSRVLNVSGAVYEKIDCSHYKRWATKYGWRRIDVTGRRKFRAGVLAGHPGFYARLTGVAV